MTFEERYGPAMRITDKEKAKAFFEELVQWHMERWGHDREHAEKTEARNLGYWSGYYGQETRKRFYEVFGLTHPIFGRV